MIIVKLDLQDGMGSVDVVVKDLVTSLRLIKFMRDAATTTEQYQSLMETNREQ